MNLLDSFFGPILDESRIEGGPEAQCNRSKCGEGCGSQALESMVAAFCAPALRQLDEKGGTLWHTV